MDSLTQITLGAACGELVLGRKIGNRAMLWGAIAGTIPDLDVLANFVTDPITALSLHRHFTHSLFFACTFPFLIAWLVHAMYDSGLHRREYFRRSQLLFWPLLVFGMVLFTLLSADELIAGEMMHQTADMLEGGIWLKILEAALVALLVALLLWLFYYRRRTPLPERVAYREWVGLFFLATVTHPMLDACTAYGTQLFRPFSAYRVALDNISVVDPLYTLPFLLFILLAAFRPRTSKVRRWLTWAGVAVSCLYLVWTFYNKSRVTEVFEQSFAERGLSYRRLATVPTLLNNILWQGVADNDTIYYHSKYSLLDHQDRLQRIHHIPKNDHLLDGHHQDRDVQILKWVTDGYYSVIQRPDGLLQFNHLRYGLKSNCADNHQAYAFKWVLLPDPESNQWIARNAPEQRSVSKNEWNDFVSRLLGNASLDREPCK